MSGSEHYNMKEEYMSLEKFKDLQTRFNELLKHITNEVIVNQLKTLWIICASQDWQYTRLGQFAVESLVGLTFQITG